MYAGEGLGIEKEGEAPLLTSYMRYRMLLPKGSDVHKILLQLKELAQELEISDNLTTYQRRHSFATILKRSGVDIALISELMGHSDLTTTQIYLDSFDEEQINTAMQHLV